MSEFWVITPAQFASSMQMSWSTVVHTGDSYGGCLDVFHTVFFVKVSLESCVGSLLSALRRQQALPGVSVTGGALRRSSRGRARSWESSLVGERKTNVTKC